MKHIWVLILTCLGLTLFSLGLHIFPGTNTMINYVDINTPNNEKFIITDGFLPWAVDFHQTLPDFKARPITTFFIEILSAKFHIRISEAFVWINFMFTFFNGFLVYQLAKLYSLTGKQALISTVIFYGCFSVLLAYFIPIATYDEPIQYFFVLVSFLFLKHKKYLLFTCSFAIAIITRENSILLLPAIFLFAMGLNVKMVKTDKIRVVSRVIICVIPVLIYFVYLTYFFKVNPQQLQETQALLPEKFAKFHKNLVGSINLSRTILSLLSVYLLPIFLLVYHSIKSQPPRFESKMRMAFWLTLTINTILVISSSYAEESRVLSLPILLIIPILGKIWTELITFSPQFIAYLTCSKRVLILFVGTSVGWLFFDQLYKLTDFNMSENLYREYNASVVFIVILIVLYGSFSSKIKQAESRDNHIA